MNNKIICFGVIFIIILSFISTGLATKKDASYIVTIPGSDQPICNLTEDEYNEFSKTIENINSDENLNEDEKSEKIIDTIVEFGIFPKELSYDNISRILGKNVDDNKYAITFPHIRPGRVYNNFGPHFILIISIGGQTVWFPFGREIPLAGNISKLIDILNIHDPFIEKLVQNITIFTYLHYTDVLFLIGSPLSIYCSIGIIPSLNGLTFFNGPFFGAYVAYFGSGIYIYNAEDIEKPIMDILFGFCAVFSIVQLLEMCDT